LTKKDIRKLKFQLVDVCGDKLGRKLNYVGVVGAVKLISHKTRVTAASYPSLSVYRIVESAPSSRAPEAETDSAGEGSESKQTTDVMSPERDIAIDTSGVVIGERDQVLDAEKLETIANAFEEICTFLNQAKHLIVSAFLCFTSQREHCVTFNLSVRYNVM